jgi:hypothetical protein
MIILSDKSIRSLYDKSIFLDEKKTLNDFFGFPVAIAQNHFPKIIITKPIAAKPNISKT